MKTELSLLVGLKGNAVGVEQDEAEMRIANIETSVMRRIVDTLPEWARIRDAVVAHSEILVNVPFKMSVPVRLTIDGDSIRQSKERLNWLIRELVSAMGAISEQYPLSIRETRVR